MGGGAGEGGRARNSEYRVRVTGNEKVIFHLSEEFKREIQQMQGLPQIFSILLSQVPYYLRDLTTLTLSVIPPGVTEATQVVAIQHSSLGFPRATLAGTTKSSDGSTMERGGCARTLAEP